MGRARASFADPASPPAQAPDGGGTRGGAAPRGPAAPAPAAGRTTAAAAAAAAPRPALPAQLVALRAAEPAALGRGQQSGFCVWARLGGVRDPAPPAECFSGPRRRVERVAKGCGARGCPHLGSATREEPALRLLSRAPRPLRAPGPAWHTCPARSDAVFPAVFHLDCLTAAGIPGGEGAGPAVGSQ